MQKCMCCSNRNRVLGTLNKNFSSWAAKIEVEEKIDVMQKACVLGTAKIIRNVLDIQGQGY